MDTWSSNNSIILLETAIDCGSPPQLVNGTVDASEGTYYRNVAKFTCNEGFELIGYDSISCQASGNWSTLTAECRSENFINYALLLF